MAPERARIELDDAHQVLTMRRFLELTPEEIGRAVDLAPSTVRHHLGKAMAFLIPRLRS